MIEFVQMGFDLSLYSESCKDESLDKLQTVPYSEKFHVKQFDKLKDGCFPSECLRTNNFALLLSFFLQRTENKYQMMSGLFTRVFPLFLSVEHTRKQSSSRGFFVFGKDKMM